MSETHRLGAIASAAFLLVVCAMSFASEVASVEMANETVGVIERPAPDFVSQPRTAPAAVIASLPLATSSEDMRAVESEVSIAPTPLEPEVEAVVSTEVTPATPVEKPKESAATPPRTVSAATPASGDFVAQVAKAIHAETNRERRAAGLAALAYDATLARNAAGYSKGLLASGVLSHTDPTGCSMTCRFKLSGYEAQAWGENLAQWESSYEPSIDELVEYFVDAWLKSDGHRDNVLSPNFTHEGVGVARDGNTFYVTVHFAKP